MTPDAHKLLDLIVHGIREGRFIPGDTTTYLTYKEVHDLLGLKLKGGTWGRSLQRQGLNDLAEWVKESKVPAVTGLIVSKIGGRPGSGYYGAFGHNMDDDEWWREEIRRAISFDWSQYSKEDDVPTLKQLTDYERSYAEGTIHNIDGQMRARCEALIRRAKSYFRNKNGELCCHACGWSRPSKALKSDIVEIHHLSRLSELPKEGILLTLSEALECLIPLCPNCHRIAHAKSNGGTHSLEELRQIVRKWPNNRLNRTGDPLRGSPDG